MNITSSPSGSKLGRPVGANGEQTRRRIIVAAMRCVAELDSAQASIREIAKVANMTSGSLYHYFPNKSELLKATSQHIEEIVLPRLRAAAGRSDDVVDRLGAVLDEWKQLERDFPHLAAFLRALRAEGAAQLRRGSPKYRESKALRDVITEIVADARAQGALSSDAGVDAAVQAILVLARGLSERAASLSPEAYDATLASAKRMIRGTLFTRSGNR